MLHTAGKNADFYSNDRLQNRLVWARICAHARALMLRSDHFQIILLGVSSGLPLVSLVAVLAFIFRYLLLA